MLIGLQLGMLLKAPADEAAQFFLSLQREFSLKACEIHLESAIYEAACRPWERKAEIIGLRLRETVSRLGVHLPFVDLNLLSPNPYIAEATRRAFDECITLAGKIQADYVVFHARGGPASAHNTDELLLWSRAIAELAAKAGEHGVSFCLENADDIRHLRDLRTILDGYPGKIQFCLDVGHLFERFYPSSFWLRKGLYLNDRFSPLPFVFKEGLPAAFEGNWVNAFDLFSDHLGCVHLHNHDGLRAHRPLLKGRIDFRPLRRLRERLNQVPLIIEADYRGETIEVVRKDIEYLEVLLS